MRTCTYSVPPACSLRQDARSYRTTRPRKTAGCTPSSASALVIGIHCHVFDNRVVEDGSADHRAYLAWRWCPCVEDAELGLASQGFRGVRFNFMQHWASAPSR